MRYLDRDLPTDERVEDLLARMRLEEKIGQMCQVDGRHDAETWIRERYIGSFLHVIGEETNRLQGIAAETRLGIPLIFGIDAIHGHAFWPQATVYPSQLAQASSWNPALVEEVGRITAVETALTGIHWTFSPVLGTARDIRWGRIGETYGEDPTLVGIMGQALIRGYQGEDLRDPHTILACAKHYAGYPGSQGGRDSYEAELTRRSLRSLYLKPFHQAVKAGCATFMTGYQTIDGVPCTLNRWLLVDVLKDEWGFEGFLVTDWDNIGRMHREQKVCATMAEASRLAVESGNDMMMSTPQFYEEALRLAQEGKLNLERVDQACRRILRLKFALGLFDENRLVDLDPGAEVIGCKAHRQASLETACQSMVLLKNQDHTLPLPENLKRIAVIGPNADDEIAQLGDWTFDSVIGSVHAGTERQYLASLSRDNVITVLQGIRERAGEAIRVDYAQGCGVLDPDLEDIPAAVDLARQADVAVVVVGDSLLQNGEVRDRADLNLSGGQQQLLEAVHATGTPMVVVLINGKPLSIPWAAEHAHAILEAWNPGSEGGAAVARILFGDQVPSGKLPISFPYHVGQQPVYYNQIPGWHLDRYMDMPAEPLYAFGYGLSYTSFAHSELKVLTPTLKNGETLQVQIDVQNVGETAGVEIVQLYVNDVFSSVTTPVKELKTFQRVRLEPGERVTVRLEVPFDQLSLVDADLETVVEPGAFEVMVGASSRDQDLLKAGFQVLGDMGGSQQKGDWQV
jgi:beta-glucosidase